MNAKLNQKQLSEMFYQINGKSRQKSELFVKSFFEIIEEELLKGEQVKVKGLGVFKTVKVEERESVNVNTGERIKINGYVKISFTPDAALKETINKPFAAFETMVLSDFQAEMISKSLEETVGDQAEEQDLEDAVSVPEVAEEEVIEVQETEESVAKIEPEAEVVAESAEEQEMVKEPEAEVVEEPIVEPEPVVELEPVVEQEPIAEPENIEGTTANVDGEVVEDKQIKEKKKHIGLRAVIVLASIILALLLLVYMLWPVIFQQYIKHQYKTSRNDVVTEQVITPESVVLEQQNVLEDSADSSTETAVENTTTVPAPAKPVTTVSETKTVAETKPVAVSNNVVKQSIKLVAEDENRDLADITAEDTDNYVIVGLLAEHTLKKDEILTILSQKYYGTKKLWPYIAKYNNFDDFNKLRPGMKILIPKLENK